MTPATLALAISAVVFAALSLASIGWLLARQAPLEPDHLGLRGRRRHQAIAGGGLFAAFDPLVRWLGARLAWLPLGGLRARLCRVLVVGGDWLGLGADELVALSLLSALGMATGGALAARVGDLPPIVVLLAAVAGLAIPIVIVTGRAATRRKQVDRGLPAAIDLAALCMSAGLDFTATLRQLTEKASRADDPLVEEIEVVLSQLALGTTRRRALEVMAERVPTEAVRALVAAIVQSEEKGSPLVETLQQQAASLRDRRSVAGEEAASRAAVMMMLPLVLILCSILLILMGPFVLRGLESGL